MKHHHAAHKWQLAPVVTKAKHLRHQLGSPTHPEAIHAMRHERVERRPHRERREIVVLSKQRELLLCLGVVEQADAAAVA